MPSANKGMSVDGKNSVLESTQRLERSTFGASGSTLCTSTSSFPPRLTLLTKRSFAFGRTEEENEDEKLTSDEMVVVERPILTEFDVEKGLELTHRPKTTPLSWAQKKVVKCRCSGPCVKRFLQTLFPFLSLLKGYSFRQDFPSDVVAGLTVGVMHIPQGMAYGQLSTLPPVYGLYVSFFPVILYFFLGSSKHVSIGTFAVVSLMVGSVVDKGMAAKGIVARTWNETVVSDDGNVTYYRMTDNSAEMELEKLRFAMAVTFAVGCVQLFLGVLRMGFLTVYLSDPLVSGFTTGAACHVFTSQIKHVFGIETGRYNGAFKLIYTYHDFFTNIPKSNSITLIASCVCIVLLVVVKEYVNGNPKLKPYLKMPVPMELIAVVLGTVISYFVELDEVYRVKIVGEVPVGIPAPTLNQFVYLQDVIADSIAVGIVAFAISISMAKILAKKNDYEIDSNQELMAYGLTNVICSFFSSYVASASLSRSLVQENAGGRTQVAGLVSSALLLIVLLVIGAYFKPLPNCILAAIIMVALKGMFQQFGELKRLWGISLIDFSVWLVSFLATVLLDVELGLMVGVLFALLTVIIRNQRPRTTLLGQIPGTDIYKDLSIFKGTEEVEHIKIFRFESALFFANTEHFKSSLYKMTVDPIVLKKAKRRADKELLRVQVVPRKSLLPPEEPKPSNGDVGGRAEEGQTSSEEAGTDGNGVALPTESLIAEPATCKKEEAATIRLPTVTDVFFIIIDCTTMGYVDSVGVKVLQQVITEMKAVDIQIFFAHCKAAVREMFEKTDFYKTRDKQCLFLTIHDAVRYAQRMLAIAEGEGVDIRSHRKSLENVVECNNDTCLDVPSRDDSADTLLLTSNGRDPRPKVSTAAVVSRHWKATPLTEPRLHTELKCLCCDSNESQPAQ